MCKGTGILEKRENFGHVVECGCGTIHVTVGPMTLALDSQALRTLHDMLGHAIQNLEAQTIQSSETQPLLMHSSHLAIKKVMKLKH